MGFDDAFDGGAGVEFWCCGWHGGVRGRLKSLAVGWSGVSVTVSLTVIEWVGGSVSRLVLGGFGVWCLRFRGA